MTPGEMPMYGKEKMNKRLLLALPKAGNVLDRRNLQLSTVQRSTQLNWVTCGKWQ